MYTPYDALAKFLTFLTGLVALVVLTAVLSDAAPLSLPAAPMAAGIGAPIGVDGGGGK